MTQTILHLEEELKLKLDDPKSNTTDPTATLIVSNALHLKFPAESFGIASFPAHDADSLEIQRRECDTEPINAPPLTPKLPIILCTRLNIPAGETSNRRGRMYSFIASWLQTLYAVTPVHTDQEYRLFSRLIRQHSTLNNQYIDYLQLARTWNTSHANGDNIFYKTPEALKAHYTAWCSAQVSVQTISRYETDVQVMREHLQSPSRQSESTILPANIPAAAKVVQSEDNSVMFAPVIPEVSSVQDPQNISLPALARQSSNPVTSQSSKTQPPLQPLLPA